MSKRPHIVIFNPDSYRGDVLGHLGNAGAVTPAVDALVAEGGVSYANAFAQNPVCTPSRCSFMTGWYPHTHGHRSMKNMLKAHEPNLLTVLRGEGYHVWWGGKNDLVAVEKPEDYLQFCDVKYKPAARYRGYRAPAALASDDPRRGAFYGGVKTPDPEAEYTDPDRASVEGAIELVKHHNDDQPLCIYLPLSWPHPKYVVEQEFYDLIDPDRLPPRLPVPKHASTSPPVLDALRKAYRADEIDEATWKDVRRIYYAMCAKIDHLFGQLVQALKDAGIYEDTLIVFMSDHGDFTGDYSLPEKTHATLQDVLLRVPLVFKLPKDVQVEPGLRHHLVELVDLPATIYDLLEIDPGYALQGRSLRRSFAGATEPVHDAVFAEVGSREAEQAFKNLDVLARSPDSFYAMQSQAVSPFADEGTYAVTCRTERYKYIRRGYNNHHELYDLQADPGELHNRIGDPALADVERQLEIRLLDFFMQTGDVLPHQQDSRKV